MAKRRTPIPDVMPSRQRKWIAPLLFVLAIPLVIGIFFVVWACLNFGWTAVFQRYVVPAAFIEPCSQAAHNAGQTADSFTGYAKRQTSRRGALIRLARCHFGEREVVIYDPTWDRKFSTREFWLFLVVDGLGLLVCLATALAGTMWLCILAMRIAGAKSGNDDVRRTTGANKGL